MSNTTDFEKVLGKKNANLGEAIMNNKANLGKSLKEQLTDAYDKFSKWIFESQSVMNSIKNIKDAIEEINEIKNVQSKLESFAVSNESLQITINELGMSDLEKSIAAATREFEALDLSILSDEEIAYATELYNARIELLKQQDEKEKMIKDQQEAEEKLAEAEKEYANTLEDLKSRILDYRISNATLGMTDEQAEIYKLEQERESALAEVGTDTDKARDIVN